MTSEEMTTSELLESDLPIARPMPTRVGAARRAFGGLLALALLETSGAALLAHLAGRAPTLALLAAGVSTLVRALVGAWYVHAQRILHRAARVDPGSEPFAPSPRVLRVAERAPLAIAALGTPIAAALVAPSDAGAALAVLAAWALGLAPAARAIAAPVEAWIARLPARDLPDPEPTGVAVREAAIAAAPALGVGLAALAILPSPGPLSALALAPALALALFEGARARLSLRELESVAAHVDALVPPAELPRDAPALRTEIAQAEWRDVHAELDAAAAALRGETDAHRQIEHEENVRSRFMAAMGHELRSPLNSIVGFAQLLEDGSDGPLSDEQHESVVMVRRSAEDLLRLLGDILDSARLDAGRLRIKRAWTPSVEIVTEAVRVGRSVVEGSRISVEATIQAGLPPVQVDRARIVQAVVATLRHAARGKGAGTLEVRAALGEGRAGERSLLVEVRDAERALGDDELARIFDEFGGLPDASSGRRVGGLGLALSLARKLVRLHGGDLWAERWSAGGTRYVVAVPLEGEGRG